MTTQLEQQARAMVARIGKEAPHKAADYADAAQDAAAIFFPVPVFKSSRATDEKHPFALEVM